MKSLFAITFIIVLSFGCTKNKSLITNRSKDSIKIYIQRGQNLKIPYELRVMYTQKAVVALQKQTNDSINNDKLIAMARNFYLLNSWKNLRKTSLIILKRSQQRKDEHCIGKAYKWLGVYYESISINDSAFYYYLKAQKIFNELNNERRLCEIFQDKAQVQYYLNDYLGAEYSLVKALKIANKMDLSYEKVRIFISLGLNSSLQDDYTRCFSYLNRALIISKEKNEDLYKNAEIVCLNNIAQSYINCNNLVKARVYVDESLKKNFEHNLLKFPQDYCTSLDLLGLIKLRSKDLKGTENLFLRSSNIRDSINIDSDVNSNKLYLSEYYQVNNQISKALKFAQEAYLLSKSYRNANDMLTCLKQLSNVDKRNALKYSQEYIRISDSMQELERVTRNKFAKIAYETEEITTEKDQAVQQKWIFLGITILLFIISALVVVLLIQRSKQKELMFLQAQQKTNEEIYQLIQNQQTKIDEARQIEKKRIAQDLHDGVMNRLASTRLNLQILAEKPSIESVKKCLPLIDGIQKIEKEIRNIAHDLNSNVLANRTSFIAVIETFFNEQKRISNRNYHLEIDMSINWEIIEGFKKIHIFRILQEAIQNIDTHAQAKNIIVSILKNENHLLMEIFDDGNGFSLNRKKKGIGLQNIYSRAKSCKGSAEIKTKINEGTTVILRIPM